MGGQAEGPRYDVRAIPMMTEAQRYGLNRQLFNALNMLQGMQIGQAYPGLSGFGGEIPQVPGYQPYTMDLRLGEDLPDWFPTGGYPDTPEEDECGPDNPCPAGYECEDGECVEARCTHDRDCGPHADCVEGECVPHEHGECTPGAGDCEEGQVCVCDESGEECRCKDRAIWGCDSNEECQDRLGPNWECGPNGVCRLSRDGEEQTGETQELDIAGVDEGTLQELEEMGWNMPSGYERVSTPGDVPNYMNVKPDPTGTFLYGKPGTQAQPQGKTTQSAKNTALAKALSAGIVGGGMQPSTKTTQTMQTPGMGTPWGGGSPKQYGGQMAKMLAQPIVNPYGFSLAGNYPKQKKK